MIEVRRQSTATVDDVWDVLADGWSYASWVVGASRVRRVTPDWPAEGAVLHHSVGAWPVLLDDSTTVVLSRPGSTLALQARGWPLGEARIEIALTPVEDGGCTIAMSEDAVAGPGRLVPYPLRAVGITPRNTETLRRLAYLAERRSR